MYKTRNTGTGNGMRGIGGMLYSGESPQTFRGMSSNIPENVLKHSGECHQTFRGMSPNIPRNVAKFSWECCQTFRGISSNIPGDVVKISGESCQTFPRISWKILRNAHNGLTFKFNDRVPKHVLLNYLLFAVILHWLKKVLK